MNTKNIDINIPCHSRGKPQESENEESDSINKDIIPLDSRERFEYDNLECLTHNFVVKLDSRIKYENDKRIESGRSMVEMLGVLAVIGVLSIGGIMGYSYAVDKYHVNETMQAVTLRGVDVLAQFDRTGDANLNEWQNQKTIYPITLEEGTIGIQVDKVPERVCDMLTDGMTHVATGIKVNGVDAVDNTNACEGDENSLVFYFDDENVANGPIQCGEVVCAECEVCDEDTETCVPIVDKVLDATVPDLDALYGTCTRNGYKSYCGLGAMFDTDGDKGCGEIGSPNCSGDPECNVYLNGSCEPLDSSMLLFVGAGGFRCTKNGQSGFCMEGVCQSITYEDPTNCGGVNCIELMQAYDYPSDYQAPRENCIVCIDGQCTYDVFNHKQCPSFSSTGGFCTDIEENIVGCQYKCNTEKDCGECEVCDEYNRICEAGTKSCSIDGTPGVCEQRSCVPLPEDNMCGGTICEADVGCSICVENECQVVEDYRVLCEKNGETGICMQGECVVACKSNSDCHSNQFCGSTNYSSSIKYINGYGVCKDFDFTSFTHEGEKYYLSKQEFSWHDAETLCSQYKKYDVIFSDVIAEHRSYDDLDMTSLGEKVTLLAMELMNPSNRYIWIDGAIFYQADYSGTMKGYIEYGNTDEPHKNHHLVLCKEKP